MWYLQEIKNYMPTYRHTDYLEVVSYLHSDFDGYVDTKKSTSRYIFLFVGGDVSWKSNKQIIITLSIMETKFIACYKATSQTL